MTKDQIIINYINFILSESFSGKNNVTFWGKLPIIYEYDSPGNYAITVDFNRHLDNMFLEKELFMNDLFKSFRPANWVKRDRLILKLWRKYNNEKTS